MDHSPNRPSIQIFGLNMNRLDINEFSSDPDRASKTQNSQKEIDLDKSIKEQNEIQQSDNLAKSESDHQYVKPDKDQHDMISLKYNDEQLSQKMKTVQSDQYKITPGYKKYMIDENNQQFDYVKGMFTEEEIKEAFDVLDMNKDGGVTSEDLQFFLDFIGEKASTEEIEEMIRMCDKVGSGEVKFEDFKSLAGGWSLPTLGQAHPPTRELVERRQQIVQMMMDKEIQEVAKKNNIPQNVVQQLKKNEVKSPRYDDTSKNKQKAKYF